ncbi:unnamed protein product, partial [Phaeothamnion confervicola]
DRRCPAAAAAAAAAIAPNRRTAFVSLGNIRDDGGVYAGGGFGSRSYSNGSSCSRSSCSGSVGGTGNISARDCGDFDRGSSTYGGSSVTNPYTFGTTDSVAAEAGAAAAAAAPINTGSSAAGGSSFQMAAAGGGSNGDSDSDDYIDMMQDPLTPMRPAQRPRRSTHSG